ncbi:MAG: hypothetical protein ABSG26_01080 [Bryobacteraceae bacterium]
MSEENERLARPLMASWKDWALDWPRYREHAEEIAERSLLASNFDWTGKVPRRGPDLIQATDSRVENEIAVLWLKDVICAFTFVASGWVPLQRLEKSQRAHV